MTHRAVLIGALAAVAIVYGGVEAFAQEQTMTLNVIAPAVKPKAPVYLNAALSNPTDVQIFQLRQTLTFRRAHLRYVRAELGVAGHLANATLTVDLEDESGAKVEDKDAAGRLQIRLVGTLPFPTGPLVEVEFRQVEDKEQVVKLTQTAEVFDAQGAAVAGLVYADPEVNISNDLGIPPLKVFGCFFYMH